MPVDVYGYVYAATVAAGGILGYVKAHSIPSLSAGLLFGSVLGYGAYQTSQDPTNIKLSVATSLVLGGIMAYRYQATGKLMPAGIIAVCSALMVVRNIVKYYGTSMKVQ
ncbi:transmembrane protein 14 homolog [Osmia lignaria lignaria]|uniref:transmembrane protein 14 homolog n=1 Tax=Osmia lignaria lignaria TaxID=1437193 RepID=UPI001478B73A|nr:transmembrane protein 14 homolog [Osmia lignaria]